MESVALSERHVAILPRGSVRRNGVWHDQGQGLSVILAIEAKIAVECPYACRGMQFRHPDQASIGERHRPVPVPPHQIAHRPVLSVEIEFGAQKPRIDKPEQNVSSVAATFDQKQSLGNHGVACKH